MANILVISSSSIISGAEYMLMDYIKNSGYKDNFFVLHSDKKNVNDFYNKHKIKNFGHKYLNPVGAERTKDIFKIIKKVKYFFLFLFVFIKIFKLKDFKLIIGNNSGDIIFSFYSFLFRKKHINFIQDIIDKKSFLAIAIKIFNIFIYKHIAVSFAVKESLIQLGISPDKILVVYNGIKIKNKVKIKKLKKILIFGFVGYMDAVKNPIECINFLNTAQKKGLLLKTKIVLGNIIDFRLYNEVLNLIKKYKLNIKIYKKIPKEKMDSYYKKLNFLLVTSVKEALPTVILEAFNNNVPVIGKKVGGIKEIIKNNYNGFLYNSPKDFIKIVNKLKMINNTKYIKIQNNIRQTLYKKFNIKNRIEKLNKIIMREMTCIKKYW